MNQAPHEHIGPSSADLLKFVRLYCNFQLLLLAWKRLGHMETDIIIKIQNVTVTQLWDLIIVK